MSSTADPEQAGAEQAEAAQSDVPDAAAPDGVPAEGLDRDAALASAQAAAADNDVAGAIFHLDEALLTFDEAPIPGEDAVLRAVLLRERAQLHVWMNSEEAQEAIEAAQRALLSATDDAELRGVLTAQLALVVAWSRATRGDAEGGLAEAMAAAELLWQAGHPAVVDAALVRGLVGKLARGPEINTLEGMDALPVELIDALVERVAVMVEHVDSRLALALLLELHERVLRLEEPGGALAPGPRGDEAPASSRSEAIAALIAQQAILAGEHEVAIDATGWLSRQRVAAGDRSGQIAAALGSGEALLRAGRGDDALAAVRSALATAEAAEPVDAASRLQAVWALAEAHAFLGRHEGAGVAFAAAVAAAAAPGIDLQQRVAVQLDQALHLAAGGLVDAALAAAREAAALCAADLALAGAVEAGVASQMIDQDAFVDPISGETDRVALLGARLRLRAPPGLIDGVEIGDDGAVEVIFARWPTTGDAGRARLLVEAGLRVLGLG